MFSFLTDDPKGLCTLLLTLGFITATLYLVHASHAIPTNILTLAEATALLILCVLVPTKMVELISEWKKKP